jgi:hypothetical protein
MCQLRQRCQGESKVEVEGEVMQIEDLFLVAGQSDQSLQTLINRIASSGMWGLIIPADYTGTDTFTNPSSVAVIDLRTNGTGLGGVLANGSGGGGGATPLTSTVVLTNAPLLNLSVTPVVLIPAPGSGKYIMPIFITFQLNVGTIPFQIANSGNGSTEVYWTNLGRGVDGAYDIAAIPDNEEAEGIDYTNATSQIYWGGVFTNGGSIPFPLTVDSSISISMTDALSAGNGDMTVVISYTIVEM